MIERLDGGLLGAPDDLAITSPPWLDVPPLLLRVQQDLLSRLGTFQDLSIKIADLLACLAIPDDNAPSSIRDLLAVKRTLAAAVARHVAASRRPLSPDSLPGLPSGNAGPAVDVSQTLLSSQLLVGA